MTDLEHTDGRSCVGCCMMQCVCHTGSVKAACTPAQGCCTPAQHSIPAQGCCALAQHSTPTQGWQTPAQHTAAQHSNTGLVNLSTAQHSPAQRSTAPQHRAGAPQYSTPPQSRTQTLDIHTSSAFFQTSSSQAACRSCSWGWGKGDPPRPCPDSALAKRPCPESALVRPSREGDLSAPGLPKLGRRMLELCRRIPELLRCKSCPPASRLTCHIVILDT